MSGASTEGIRHPPTRIYQFFRRLASVGRERYGVGSIGVPEQGGERLAGGEDPEPDGHAGAPGDDAATAPLVVDAPDLQPISRETPGFLGDLQDSDPDDLVPAPQDDVPAVGAGE